SMKLARKRRAPAVAAALAAGAVVVAAAAAVALAAAVAAATATEPPPGWQRLDARWHCQHLTRRFNDPTGSHADIRRMTPWQNPTTNSKNASAIWPRNASRKKSVRPSWPTRRPTT